MVQVIEDCRVAAWEPPSDTGGEITVYRARVYHKIGGVRTSPTFYDPIETQWLVPPTLPEQRPLYFQVGWESAY